MHFELLAYNTQHNALCVRHTPGFFVTYYELAQDGSDSRKQTGAMKQSRGIYASVGIAASSFADIISQTVSYELFKFKA